MPVGAPEVGEPSPLSGDVAPSADLTTAFCAGTASQLNKSAAIVRSIRGMGVTCIARRSLRRSGPPRQRNLAGRGHARGPKMVECGYAVSLGHLTGVRSVVSAIFVIAHPIGSRTSIGRLGADDVLTMLVRFGEAWGGGRSFSSAEQRAGPGTTARVRSPLGTGESARPTGSSRGGRGRCPPWRALSRAVGGRSRRVSLSGPHSGRRLFDRARSAQSPGPACPLSQCPAEKELSAISRL